MKKLSQINRETIVGACQQLGPDISGVPLQLSTKKGPVRCQLSVELDPTKNAASLFIQEQGMCTRLASMVLMFQEDNDKVLVEGSVEVNPDVAKWEGHGLGSGLLCNRDNLTRIALGSEQFGQKFLDRRVVAEIKDASTSVSGSFGRHGWTSYWAERMGYEEVEPEVFRKVIR